MLRGVEMLISEIWLPVQHNGGELNCIFVHQSEWHLKNSLATIVSRNRVSLFWIIHRFGCKQLNWKKLLLKKTLKQHVRLLFPNVHFQCCEQDQSQHFRNKGWVYESEVSKMFELLEFLTFYLFSEVFSYISCRFCLNWADHRRKFLWKSSASFKLNTTDRRKVVNSFVSFFPPVISVISRLQTSLQKTSQEFTYL